MSAMHCNRIVSVKDRPHNQCLRFLKWFEDIGVDQFDIHVKRQVPGSRCGNRTGEKWITCHDGLHSARVMELWPWLRHENAQGSDIYFRPHGFAANPVLFLDDLDIDTDHRVAKAYSCAVVQTSDNNTHVWVKTALPLLVEQRKMAQSELSSLGFSDPASTSGDHLGRLCGMVSYKHRSWVNVILFSTPRAYQPTLQKPTSLSGGGGARVSPNHNHQSESERDFGWTVGMLKAGIHERDILKRLEDKARARGKRNPELYARLTVTNAGAVVENLNNVDRR